MKKVSLRPFKNFRKKSKKDNHKDTDRRIERATKTIYVGVNNVDYSGYPDCRPAFIKAFAEAARLGTCACDENWAFDIRTPLQALSKAEIIQKGIALGVDYSKTVSCYQADDDGRACGVCDSCILRKAGFAAAGVADQTRYR